MFDEFGSGCRHLAPYGRRGCRDRLLPRRATGQKQAEHQPGFPHALCFLSLGRTLVDGDLGYMPRCGYPCEGGRLEILHQLTTAPPVAHTWSRVVASDQTPSGIPRNVRVHPGPSGRIFDTIDRKLEEVEWLLNYARNANKPIPVASAITTKKVNAPRRSTPMKLLNSVTYHQKTKSAYVPEINPEAVPARHGITKLQDCCPELLPQARLLLECRRHSMLGDNRGLSRTGNHRGSVKADQWEVAFGCSHVSRRNAPSNKIGSIVAQSFAKATPLALFGKVSDFDAHIIWLQECELI